jgi:hypothetical protein
MLGRQSVVRFTSPRLREEFGAQRRVKGDAPHTPQFPVFADRSPSSRPSPRKSGGPSHARRV